MEEGDIMNGIMHTRIFRDHKHFVQVTVGPPGSGKSYGNIREAELWYKKVLHRPFPIENICFSPEAVLEKLRDHNLEGTKGEIVIYEEGGTSMGNLDFQTKVSKIFNYVLQSFRSMNLILFINLPYFNMLNKQTRQLSQFLLESKGIDKRLKKALFKPFFIQTNQRDGEIYLHYPKAVVNQYYEKIETIGYSMPSEEIIEPYERKKKMFNSGLLSSGIVTIQDKNKKSLSPTQTNIYALWKNGTLKNGEIGKILGIATHKIYKNVTQMRKKGYLIEEFHNKCPIIIKQPQNSTPPT